MQHEFLAGKRRPPRAGSERMDKQPGAQLRLEPSAFRRHDLSGVGDVHQLVRSSQDTSKKPRRHPHRPGARVRRAANSSDEIHALARPRIVDAEERRKKLILEHADVEAGHRIRFGIDGQRKPYHFPSKYMLTRPTPAGVADASFSKPNVARTLDKKSDEECPFKSNTMRLYGRIFSSLAGKSTQRNQL